METLNEPLCEYGDNPAAISSVRPEQVSGTPRLRGYGALQWEAHVIHRPRLIHGAGLKAHRLRGGPFDRLGTFSGRGRAKYKEEDVAF